MEEKFEVYIPLVKSIAGNFKVPFVSFDDLVQEGLIGVLEAQKRFNPRKDVMFSTYAVYWIKKKILKYIEKEQKYFLPSVENDEELDKQLFQDITENSGELKKEKILNFDKLEELDEIEKRILKSFFEENKPLDMISKELNIRREKVRQLKNKALRKLKINNKLTDSLYTINR